MGVHSIWAFLIAIFVLVTIHEWGHYWVAKRCGVYIEKFSIGFGKVLFSWKNKEGTVFCLSLIPLGGYVKMKGEYSIATEENQQHAEKGSFAACSVWQRIAIVAAGPFVNLAFAALVFAFFAYGSQTYVAPIVAKPAANSLFTNIGLTNQSTVLSVNQKQITHLQDVQRELIDSILSQKNIKLSWKDPQGVTHQSAELETRNISLDDPLWEQKVGLEPYMPNIVIQRVEAASPAEQAGLQVADSVLGLNGQNTSGNEVLQTIRTNPEQELILNVKRGEQVLDVKVKPRVHIIEHPNGASRVVVGQIGIATKASFETVAIQHGVMQAMVLGVQESYSQSILNLKGLYKIVTGQLSLKNIGGPVTIAKQAGDSAQSGIASFVLFLAVISVSLGTLNLLLIPVLDGGHLVYYVAEIVRGKPLPEVVLATGQKIGLILLLMFMGIALTNDLRWFL